MKVLFLIILLSMVTLTHHSYYEAGLLLVGLEAVLEKHRHISSARPPPRHSSISRYRFAHIILVETLTMGFVKQALTTLVLGVSVNSAFSCLSVSSWGDLQSVFAGSESKVVLCPFKITKPGTEKIIVNRSIDVSCRRNRKCVITGSGIHILVKGANAQMALSGFVFQGATKSSISIAPSSTLEHSLEKCIFRSNDAIEGTSTRGGAIRTSKGTHLRIVSTIFVRNSAKIGGAVYHQGANLALLRSTFRLNHAEYGGIVHLATQKIADISRTKFVDNDVGSTNTGAAISADDIASR